MWAGVSAVSCKGGEQVCAACSAARALSTQGSEEGGVDILAFALGGGAQAVGWPANKSRNPCRSLQEWSRKGSRDHLT